MQFDVGSGFEMNSIQFLSISPFRNNNSASYKHFPFLFLHNPSIAQS